MKFNKIVLIILAVILILLIFLQFHIISTKMKVVSPDLSGLAGTALFAYNVGDDYIEENYYMNQPEFGVLTNNRVNKNIYYYQNGKCVKLEQYYYIDSEAAAKNEWKNEKKDENLNVNTSIEDERIDGNCIYSMTTKNLDTYSSKKEWINNITFPKSKYDFIVKENGVTTVRSNY